MSLFDGVTLRYLRIAPLRIWLDMLRPRYRSRRVGLFGNLPHVRPGRWGIYVFGLEIGSRNPGDPVGTWLRRKGLYPW